ncbi:GSCFA family protein [Rhizobium etli 8C-3]|uniref:GSCFA family protein n=1 Tax=Rhizobium etli 8C-3 TaxID=538025 RepID=A0A1L5P6W1_RHIET|nr:GSCFA domain-containing protein [Rhizobium etli]APO75884.1 GSCFA family protein [Rhizobium etli 8C-3]
MSAAAEKTIIYRVKRALGLVKKEESANHIFYETGKRTRRAHATWYRGETTNFYPDKQAIKNLSSVDEYVGKGWLPTAPLISKEHYITAFGSCFASEVTKFLYNEGYQVFGRDMTLNSYVVRSGEGIVNSAAIRQQFEWAFEGKVPKIELWHDKAGVPGDYSDDVRDSTKQIFEKSDVFILTLGLSEVWYDKPTGEIFWRAIPKRDFDPQRHGFRVMSAAENLDNLRRIYELIRTHRPDATIIVTLSPVPLAATFRPVSCITANSVSKASLRVAIDELMREPKAAQDERFFYFPSYEIITSFLPDPMKDDFRHPTDQSVDFIMRTFQRHFLI